MATATVLTCDMERDCKAPINYIDNKGYTYCTAHGVMRRVYRPCRKLTAAEKAKLENGETLSSY